MQKWLFAPSPQTVFVTASGGQGKSVIAKSILTWLRNNVAIPGSHNVLRFFCKARAGQDTSSSIVSSLLFHILSVRRDLLQRVFPTYDILSQGDLRSNKLSFESLWQLLVSVTSEISMSDTYVVIDGLNECSIKSQTELLECVRSMTTPRGSGAVESPHLRFFITTRPPVYVPAGHANISLIKIRPQDIDPDIRLFVHTAVVGLPQLEDCDSDIRDALSRRIASQACGLFLWADVVINKLRRQPGLALRDQDIIWDFLTSLPPQLEKLYLQTWNNIPSESRRFVLDVMEILLAAARPLNTREMHYMLHFQKDFNYCATDIHETILEDILDLCHTFVRLDQSGIEIAHSTVRDFLTDEQYGDLLLQVPYWPLDVIAGHVRLSRACISYLQQDGIREKAAETSTDAGLYQDNAILNYSARYWPTHVHASAHKVAALLNELEIFSDPDLGAHALWVSRLSISAMSPRSPTSGSSFLHTMAIYDMVDLLRFVDFPRVENEEFIPDTEGSTLILRQGQNGYDDNGKTALWLACALDHAEFAEVLLSKHVTIDIANVDGSTSLHIACIRGRHRVIELLLNHHADHKLQTTGGVLPIHIMVFLGNIEGLRILLNHVANPREVALNDSSLLFIAAANNHLSMIRFLLTHYRMDPKVPNVEGTLPIHAAAAEGHHQTVQLLLPYHEGVDVKTHQDWTLLMVACISKSKALVEYLLQKGADINARNSYGGTPLHVAGVRKQRDIVQLLCTNHANLDLQDNDGSTPLMTVCSEGHTGIVVDLLQHGADANLRDNNMNSAIHFAASRGHKEITRLLLDHNVPVDFKGLLGFSPLYTACLQGRHEVVKLLLERRADPNAESDDSWTPVFAAVFGGSQRILLDILRAGGHVHHQGPDGFTPLATAVLKGKQDAVEHLLATNADINAKISTGASILSMGIAWGQENVASYLIKQGADITWVGAKGDHLLHVASREGSLRVVRDLCASGVQIDAEDTEGCTSLYVAALKGHDSVFDFLLTMQADINRKNVAGQGILHAAALGGNPLVVRKTLENGVPADEATELGWTALHLCICVEVAQLLIDAGSHVNSVTNTNITPLHEAVIRGRLDLVLYLTSVGAEIDSRALDGFTPLHVAAQEGHEAIMKHLLEGGADSEAVTAGGATVLGIAASKGHLKAMSVMLERRLAPNQQVDGKATALYQAVTSGQTSAVHLLLQKSANPNLSTNSIMPLHQAATLGLCDIISVLLKHGADPYARTKRNLTPLTAAVLFNQYTVVAQLLEDTEIDVNAQCPTIDTALHLSAKHGHVASSLILLEAGADLASITKVDHKTPLHIAAEQSSVFVAALLLEKGASVDPVSIHGRTPLAIAVARGHLPMVRLLIKAGASVIYHAGSLPLWLAVANDHEAVFDCLLEHGAKPQETINLMAGNSLHAAARYGCVSMMKKMMQIVPEAANSIEAHGDTPLHVAVQFDQKLIVNVLLQYQGLDLGCICRSYTDALTMAVLHENTDIVSQLLERGADPNLSNDWGNTAFTRAVWRRAPNIIKILLKGGGDVLHQDCFGSTICNRIEQLDIDIKLETSSYDVRTNEKDESRLRRTIVFAVNKLLQQERISFRTDDAVFYLAKALLMLGWVDEAATMLEQRLQRIYDDHTQLGSFQHPTTCDICRTNDGIRGVSYICVECPDSDFCAECWLLLKEGKNTTNSQCKVHTMLAIPREVMRSADDNTIFMEEPEAHSWLRKLLARVNAIQPP